MLHPHSLSQRFGSSLHPLLSHYRESVWPPYHPRLRHESAAELLQATTGWWRHQSLRLMASLWSHSACGGLTPNKFIFFKRWMGLLKRGCSNTVDERASLILSRVLSARLICPTQRTVIVFRITNMLREMHFECGISGSVHFQVV